MIHFSLKEIQAGLLAKRFTMVALVEAYLEQAQTISDHNAYIEIFEKEIREAAQQLDLKIKKDSEKLGPLFGAVLSIKDNLCYKGHIATAASKILEGFVAPYNATVIERVLGADALIIGRTNCDEMSMGSTNESSYYGPAKNAIDPTKVPGGSSGGGAVAVALSTCLISIGSDTGGSIRQPAAFNGVLGYKPSYGVISRWGLMAYGSSFDTIGLLGKQIEDMQAVMQVVSGPDDYDSTALTSKIEFTDRPASHKTMAYSQKMMDHPSVESGLKRSAEVYMDKMRAKGYSLVDVDVDFADMLVPCYYILATAEASSNLSRYDGVRYGHRSAIETDDYQALMRASRTEGFGKEVKKRILLGTYVLSDGYYDAYYKQAQKVRRLIKNKVSDILSQHEYFLLPTTSAAAWKLGHQHADPLHAYLSDMYTVLANLCGIPAISLVMDNIEGKMPFGMQLMAQQGQDEQLLAEAKQLINAL